MAWTSLGREHTQVWLVDQLRSFSSHSPPYLPDTGHTDFFFFGSSNSTNQKVREGTPLHVLGFSLPSHASPRPVSPPHSPTSHMFFHRLCGCASGEC